MPEHTVRDLKKIHKDLAWAIVTLADKRPHDHNAPTPADAELVAIADHRSLIVVNRAIVKKLPGVHIIPLNGSHAFLALDPGQGMADLELAVLDRLEHRSLGARERRALLELRTQLRKWRRDRNLDIQTHAIIVVEEKRRVATR